MPLTEEIRFTVDTLKESDDQPLWLHELERIVEEYEAEGIDVIDEEVIYIRCNHLDTD
jgi:hypothetical protein